MVLNIFLQLRFNSRQVVTLIASHSKIGAVRSVVRFICRIEVLLLFSGALRDLLTDSLFVDANKCGGRRVRVVKDFEGHYKEKEVRKESVTWHAKVSRALSIE